MLYDPLAGQRGTWADLDLGLEVELGAILDIRPCIWDSRRSWVLSTDSRGKIRAALVMGKAADLLRDVLSGASFESVCVGDKSYGRN